MKRQKLLTAIIGLLILQFMLGMLANLYSKIPAQKPYEVFHEVGFINLHALNGTMLLVLGIILAVRSRHQTTFRPTLAGLGHMVLAFVSGELFVFTQNDIFSLLMALAFLGAFMSYLRIMYNAS